MSRSKTDINQKIKEIERKKVERARRKGGSTKLVSASPKRKPRKRRAKRKAVTKAPVLRRVPQNYEEAKLLYGTPWYKEWRNYILERDGFVCQMCGQRGNLEVHHIRPKYLYPELTLDKDNGITLCKVCHQDRVTRHEHRFEFIFDRIVKLNRR